MKSRKPGDEATSQVGAISLHPHFKYFGFTLAETLHTWLTVYMITSTSKCL